IGVTQALNKRGGPFTIEDEARLRAFTAQVSIALENAQLFNDVQNMRNYNESVLQSMSSGVITTNDEGKVVTCNVSGLKMFKVGAEEIIGKTIVDFFTGDNQWVADLVKHVSEKQTADVLMDAELKVSETKVSVNMTVLPLIGLKKEKLGTMLMIDDISSEKRVKATMAKYMDPYLADQLLTSGEVNLGGQSVNATVLFSDIRGFTTLTEELGAQGTVSLLNEYFTLMVDCIQQQGGTLDKFIGDAIMAVFGTPLPLENGEDKAVKAAINMLRELNEYNARRHSDGKKPIDMGIGLNTDSVVSGNIGSPKRMDYTIIGDGVNLASRLESACKQYAARILISDSTYKALKGTYRVRDIDRVVVKGKTEPAGVFEVLDYHTDQSFPNLMDVVNYFNEGIKLYRQQRWDDAVTRFRRALEANPSDRLSSIYIERCGIMKENPPEDGWNGVWVLESK
ncbi:MAG: PAS domain-containing protein, partial [Planctomycetaceae bacterium]|nr:PAS domain-containing protein [Planctomycetaceae bacterium]